ncbi:MAG: 2-oxo acid dehydrogenase subunit E2 [Candidatus Eisenbacteria bacterium]|nr:2-oxo acid dehydrogenase subunit E2 [Candidatus Eisenbacteria bacterium]
MKVEMVMPQMGESIAEGTILKWVKKVGDMVKKDENVLEISTDKVDSEIPSPAAGRIVELKANEGDTVPVGQVIAIIDTMAAGEVPAPASSAPTASAATPAPAPVAAAPAPAPAPAVAAPVVTAPVVAPVASSSNGGVVYSTATPGAPVPREFAGKFFSPLVRSIARHEGISAEELAAIAGTGRDGRVTRDDLLRHLEARTGMQVGVVGTMAGLPASGPVVAQPLPHAAPPSGLPNVPARPAAAAPLGAAPSARPVGVPAGAIKSPFGGDTYPKFTVAESRETPEGRIDLVPMDNMRQKIAEHMVRSKQVSPHVASVTEVDMTPIVRHREAWKAHFQAQYGVPLTYTSYILQATVKALQDYPMMNASVDGTTVLIKRFINLGVAVALDNGLIVPVIKHAEEKNFLGVTRALNDLSTRARSKQLKPDDIAGGTFTVTNMGSFGNLFGIPIISQPQVGILGVGAIVKRPVVIDEMIAIRDIMYLSLSYDHRTVDGALGGLFIQRVRQYLESGELVGSL